MRSSRARLAGALALVPMLGLTATACGDDSDSGSGKPLTAEQLKAVLPVQADYPAGLTLDTDGSGGAGGREIAKDAACQPLLDLIDPDAAPKKPLAFADNAATRMDGDMPAETVAVGLWAFPGSDGRTLFDEGKAALGKCSTVTSTDDEGGESSFEFKPASTGKFGDATLAFTLKQNYEDMTFYGALVIVRVGDHQASFAHMDLTKEASLPDNALVKKVVDKLKAEIRKA